MRTFAEIIHENGLTLILRIGPWIGENLSLGGLPTWLLDENVELRVSDSRFLDFVEEWWWRLFKEIEGLEWINGGSIIEKE